MTPTLHPSPPVARSFEKRGVHFITDTIVHPTVACSGGAQLAAVSMPYDGDPGSLEPGAVGETAPASAAREALSLTLTFRMSDILTYLPLLSRIVVTGEGC